ncbi:hypothetical protein [Sediminibacillus sp. JSM 1682029]|uniref:hypothetical protein n=1 Tax=Sediminibacillus sp. JSM 1682029 TaxID=3229857 RepID=UPI0035242C68
MSIPLQGDESLLEQVKCLQGKDYLTIEGTEGLTERKLICLIQLLKDHRELRKIPTITILVEGNVSENLESELRNGRFYLHDEVVFYQRGLEEFPAVHPVWDIRSLNELDQQDFLKVWEKVISGSLNAASTLSMEKQMDSVKAELGNRYKDSCLTVFEEKKPIGVVIPHIEPGTEAEGRLFYFGLVPEERNKRKSRLLHLHALARLKHDFQAAVYVGSTSVNNLPMRKVFERNDCEWTSKKQIYKRTIT